MASQIDGRERHCQQDGRHRRFSRGAPEALSEVLSEVLVAGRQRSEAQPHRHDRTAAVSHLGQPATAARVDHESEGTPFC